MQGGPALVHPLIHAVLSVALIRSTICRSPPRLHSLMVSTVVAVSATATYVAKCALFAQKTSKKYAQNTLSDPVVQDTLNGFTVQKIVKKRSLVIS